MKKSELEECFELTFRKRLTRAGFKFQTEQKIKPAAFRYDVKLTRGPVVAYIELDGHGFGHSSAAAKKRDAEKGNLAVLSGGLFFRLTTSHFRKLKGVRVPGEYAHKLIDRLIAERDKSRQWRRRTKRNGRKDFQQGKRTGGLMPCWTEWL